MPVGFGDGALGDARHPERAAPILVQAKAGDRAVAFALARRRARQLAACGQQHRLAQHGRRQVAGRDGFGRRIEIQIERGHVGDDVVEDAQRGRAWQAVGIAAVDQRRAAVDAGRAQQGFEQDRVVLAVAIAVGQHQAGRVRHHAARAHVHAHVADMAPHPVRQRQRPGARRVQAGRQRSRQLRNGGADGGLVARALVVGARECRVVGEGRHRQPLAVIEVADRFGFDALVRAVHVLPLVHAAPGPADGGHRHEADRVGMQRHRGGHVVHQVELAVQVELGRGQVFEMAGKQRRVAREHVVHDQLVANGDVGEHDDFHARILEHGRLGRDRFLLVDDLRRRHCDAAPVGLLRVSLHRADRVEAAVVADVILAVRLHGALLGNGLDVLDRHAVAAVFIYHEMLDVLVDHQRGIGIVSVRGGAQAQGGKVGEDADEHE